MFSKMISILFIVMFASTGAFAQEKAPAQENDPFSFTVFVDYKSSTYESLKAAFDGVAPELQQVSFFNEGSPDSIPRHVTFEYINARRPATTQEVLKEVDRRNLRPATAAELVAFARANPYEQMRYPIVALGTTATWKNRPLVVALDHGVNGRRTLNAYYGDFLGVWMGNEKFLVVRE